MPELPASVFSESDAVASGDTDQNNDGGRGGEQVDLNQSNQSNEPGNREAAQLRRFLGRSQQSDLPLVSTIGEAQTHVTNMLQKQLDLATDNGAEPNVAISGDAAVRTAFFTLLPDEFQRRVFLTFASNSRAWPRLKSLFGAPPYAFLGPQDAGMLRAAGISSARQNMTYDSNEIVNYSQFGAGQLIDDSEREYRVIDPTAGANDALPCNLEGGNMNSEYIHLIVRVHKRSRAERLRRLRDARLKKTIMFPMAGEKLNLTETKRLLSIQGKRPEAATRAVLQVRQVKPRGLNAATASVLAVWS